MSGGLFCWANRHATCHEQFHSILKRSFWTHRTAMEPGTDGTIRISPPELTAAVKCAHVARNCFMKRINVIGHFRTRTRRYNAWMGQQHGNVLKKSTSCPICPSTGVQCEDSRRKCLHRYHSLPFASVCVELIRS
ncbi:unnamed protein product [Albugo candida]|uniref:Uncharacterized protein n=1 Tax=Albugo candida TaxID=65357 RepID=A0A024GM64_9STRA|nr:unnamed protein product [Albugo candida]|eukprot:CCI47951.1 unnamed protein product [Albugo candida]